MELRKLEDAWARRELRDEMLRRATKAQAARPFLQTLKWTPEQQATYDARIRGIHHNFKDR